MVESDKSKKRVIYLCENCEAEKEMKLKWKFCNIAFAQLSNCDISLKYRLFFLLRKQKRLKFNEDKNKKNCCFMSQTAPKEMAAECRE